MLPLSDGLSARCFTIVSGGGVAFFAHVGGLIFGLVAASVLTSAGRVIPQSALVRT